MKSQKSKVKSQKLQGESEGQNLRRSQTFARKMSDKLQFVVVWRWHSLRKLRQTEVCRTSFASPECKAPVRFRRQSRCLIFAFCLLPFAFPLMGCREKTAAAEPAPVAVKIKPVELNPISKGVRYSANIEPMKQVEVAFKVSGYVDQILQTRGVDGRMHDVQAGDTVTPGTVLARVRQSDYAVKVSQAESQAAEAKSGLESGQSQFADAQASVASSRAQLTEAEAALGKAGLDFDRAKNLFASQSMTKADYDAAKNAVRDR